MHDTDNDTRVRDGLDRCVKCGLCLPECPTYRLAGDENESPRGRLALIDGLVRGQLAGDRSVTRHLDNCLGCRRCERVCPSQVPYGRLLDAGRARLATPGRRRLARLLQRPALQRAATALGRRIPLRVTRPIAAAHRLHALAHALPAGPAVPEPGVHPASPGPSRGRVGLFAGCSGNALQAGALTAATTLIRRAGFDVVIPHDTGCCGALAAHAGDPGVADDAAADTRRRFAGLRDGVVSIASGCGIHLDAYAPPIAGGHRDICDFLDTMGGLDADMFRPDGMRVALHVPCSVHNVYRGGHWAARLLALPPGLEVVEIGRRGQCCGAAGDHMLRRPRTAERLRRPLLDALADLRPDVLVTGNVGCALHLAAGLRAQGVATEVVHPVELLARLLR